MGQPAETLAKEKYVCLDLARGLAALTVAAGHLRAFLFVDYGTVAHPNPLWKAFYFLTGFGHQAVMVFFVMSGFLVGSHVYDAVAADRWSWRGYAIKRLTRLWIVLIPALALTALWDNIGIHVLHSSFYFGGMVQAFNVGPAPQDAALHYLPATFAANALFLQTIVAPTFGTNGPLWSLANEFWYYLIFPLGVLAVHRRTATAYRLAAALAAVALCVLLPRIIVLYGGIWLAGFAVARVRAMFNPRLGPLALGLCTTASLALFLGSIFVTRLFGGDIVSDFACGGAFCLLLYFLTRIEVRKGLLSRASKALSDFSYSLYLTHFPLVALVCMSVFAGARMQPSLVALAIYGGALAAVTFYGWLVYLLFERRTKAVQDALSVRFLKRAAVAA